LPPICGILAKNSPSIFLFRRENKLSFKINFSNIHHWTFLCKIYKFPFSPSINENQRCPVRRKAKGKANCARG
jgi:hypothetical protein